MPLKTTPSGQIAMLKSYTPYDISGETLAEDITNMISYDVQEPVDPIDIQFTFGATQPIVKTFTFKNLTKNREIELMFEFDKEVFDAPTTVTISPASTISVPFRMRIDNLQPGMSYKPFDLKITAKNIKQENSGPLAFLQPNATPLEPVLLDPFIALYQ